ncbi:hydrolase [Mesorhizobium sp. L-8-10]|nr:hydrolase [Mesorhizobium sp. L-8-10]
MMRGVLLDLAGVVYDGEKPIAGGIEAVAALRDACLPLRFVSNTTRLAKPAIVAKLHAMGLDIGTDEVFAPAAAARDWLLRHRRSPHLLIHPGLEPEFRDLPRGGQPAVVIGDAGEAFTYSALNEAFRLLDDGADFLALAANRTFRDGDGRLSLDAGPFVTALEFATGRHATVLGKPSVDFFLAALADMGCEPETAAMVGDDAEADVAGALRAGLATALLVRSGKYRPGDETRFDPPPTAVVDDLAAAATWIIERRGP